MKNVIPCFTSALFRNKKQTSKNVTDTTFNVPKDLEKMSQTAKSTQKRLSSIRSWTIIRTEITCKKIHCYTHSSAYKWFIVKKAKIFRNYVKHF